MNASQARQFLIFKKKCEEDGFSIEITSNGIGTYYFELRGGVHHYLRSIHLDDFKEQVLNFIKGYKAK